MSRRRHLPDCVRTPLRVATPPPDPEEIPDDCNAYLEIIRASDNRLIATVPWEDERKPLPSQTFDITGYDYIGIVHNWKIISRITEQSENGQLYMRVLCTPASVRRSLTL